MSQSVFNEQNTEIIIAGPGVGKTTELLNRIEMVLAEDISTKDIAFFSFSNTAVDEGLNRLVTRMEYTKNSFPYFRTLHSMAFSLLGLTANQIITRSLMGVFAKQNNLKLGMYTHDGTLVKCYTPDAMLLAKINTARMLQKPLRQYLAEHIDEDISIDRAEDIADKYEKFKQANGVIDFTDMLILANMPHVETPAFKYVFIDEAQDLSTLQWKLVEKIAANTEQIVIVGDERQAIADFAGADVDYFLSIKGRMTVLNRSHRVPRTIFNLARKVEKHMKKTRNADWYPRKQEPLENSPGEIIRTTELPVRAMARGSWLVLVRTNSQLADIREFMLHCYHKLPAAFQVDGKPAVPLDVFKAIQIFQAGAKFEDFNKYTFITPEDTDTPEMKKQKENFVMLLKKFMTSSDPTTPVLDNLFLHHFKYRNWFDAFDKLTIPERKYINAIKDAYYKNKNIFANAKIKLSTIHSAKGMEADNVVLCTALTYKTFHEWELNKDRSDTEEKVLFVAITRARKKLYLMGQKRQQMSYNSLLE